MSKKRTKQVVWLYFEDHLKHPFISLGANELADNGYTVTVVDLALDKGNTSYQHISIRWAARCKRYLENAPLLVRLIKWSFVAIFMLPMLGYALAKKPSYVIVTTLETAFVGWLTAFLMRARLIYHPFELVGEQHSSLNNIRRIVDLLFVSKGIDALITQNEERAKFYLNERRSPVKPIIVHNYKPYKKVKPAGKLRELLDLPSDCRIVLYEGYFHPGRWLKELAQSAKYLPDDTKLVFIGQETGWWKHDVEPLLKTPPLSNKTAIGPWIPHEKLMSYVADADVGIIIYDDQLLNNFYCEPGKLSDYMLAGIPVVAPNFPTIAPIIIRYGIGSIFNRPEPLEIARAINKVLMINKNSLNSALDEARKELIWETQKANFFKAIKGT